MKKSILLLTFTILTLFSCSSSDDGASINPEEIVGTWNLDSATIGGDEVGSSYKIQFTSTQRAKFYYQNPTSNTTFGPDIIENGDYTLNSNFLNISWDESGSTQYQILELTSNKLKIKSVDFGETLIEVYTK
jgi:hypothetical protein